MPQEIHVSTDHSSAALWAIVVLLALFLVGFLFYRGTLRVPTFSASTPTNSETSGKPPTGDSQSSGQGFQIQGQGSVNGYTGQ